MANPIVNIWLEDDPTVGVIVKVYPDPVHVSSSRGESVVWQCADGAAKVLFKGTGGGPFRSPQFDVPTGGFVGSGLPLRGKPGEQHKYTVTVTRASDNRKYELDPQVIVDNGA
jgi:hypothetical protein